MNKPSVWLSSIALLLALVAAGFTFFRTTPIEADWVGILVGILALLTTILLGWQIISYLGFKDEVRKDVEKTKKELRKNIDELNNKIPQEIKEAQGIIYQKNELYSQGIVAYTEAFAIVIREESGPCDLNYGIAYKLLVEALDYFCRYGDKAENHMNKCVIVMKMMLPRFEELLKAPESPGPFNNNITENFKNLKLSQDIDFIKMKANILNYESNNKGAVEYVKAFLECEKRRESLLYKFEKKSEIGLQKIQDAIKQIAEP